MHNLNIYEKIQDMAMFFVPFLFALSFHEFAHAWMAKRRGDRTAEMLGRLSLSPLAHADLIGTVILPLIAVFTQLPLFGWARPVPVNPRNLPHPRDDMFWIALAGPASNMILAVAGAAMMFALLHLMPVSISDSAGVWNVVLRMLVMFISVNVFLAIFNMIPLHPLDGGKVFARFLPVSLNDRLEEAQAYTSFILVALFVSGAFSLIARPAHMISLHLMRLAGLPLGA